MYLTKADRENILMLVGMEDALTRLEAQWVEHNRPKEWLKPIRMAKTWVGKTSDAIRDSIDNEDINRIHNMLDKYSLVLMLKQEAKQAINAHGTINVNLDVWGNLAEAVLESQCQGCNKKDFKGCKFRSALMDAVVPAFDEQRQGCQYRY